MKYPKIYKCRCGKMIYAFDISDIQDHYYDDNCDFASVQLFLERMSKYPTMRERVFLWNWDYLCGLEDLKVKIYKN